ncbi:MAG: hypothetical protein O2819_02895 [Planctomycetota bacterium]|nr:hypothetical protein [Planctomycetota bacterium]MDA1105085.1 hypothetical protein [Planctomycetota bacterium]
MSDRLAVWLEGELSEAMAHALAKGGRTITSIGCAGRGKRVLIPGCESSSRYDDPRIMAREIGPEPVLLVGSPSREIIGLFTEGGRAVAATRVPGIARLPSESWGHIERVPGIASSPEVDWLAETVQQRGPIRHATIAAWWPSSDACLATLVEDAIQCALRIAGFPVEVSVRASATTEGEDAARRFLRDSRGSLAVTLLMEGGGLVTISASNIPAIPCQEIKALGDSWEATVSPGWTHLSGTTPTAQAPELSAIDRLSEQFRQLGSVVGTTPGHATTETAHAVLVALTTGESCDVAEASRLLSQ